VSFAGLTTNLAENSSGRNQRCRRMARIIGRGFSFDDVLIVPKYNKILSRKDVSLKTKVTRNY